MKNSGEEHGLGSRPARRRLLRGLALGVAGGLLLRPLPLVGSLTYEYALAMGLVLFAVGLAVGAADGRRLARVYATRWRSLDDSPPERLREGLRSALAGLAGASFGAILVPALIEELVGGCRWERGLPVFAFVVLPLAIDAYALGLVAGVRRGWWLVIGLIVGSLALTLYEGLAGPRVLLHNLLIGVATLSGYLGFDAAVSLSGSFLLNRLYGLLLAGLLVVWAVEQASRRAGSTLDDPFKARVILDAHRRAARRLLVLLALPVVSLALLAPDGVGVGSGRTRLEETLSERLETEHFVIRYSPGSRVAEAAASIAEAHEWGLSRLVELLEVEPPQRRITSYVYADDDEYEAVTGARDFLFTKPWLGEMHVRLLPGWGGPEVSALEHELSHVLAADFGLPLLRVSARYGLIEGFAEAVGGDYGRAADAHASVAAAARRGLVPAAAELVSTLGFAGSSAGGAYGAAGSFCGWLLLRYGPHKLRDVYAWGDFEAVYGVGLTELDRGWKSFLARIAAGPSEAREGFATFEAPPFYRSRCPRLGERARGGAGSGQPPACEELLAGVSPPDLRLARCLIEVERRVEARDLLGTLSRDGPSARERDAALALLEREAAERGAAEEARSWLEVRVGQGFVGPVRRGLELAAIASPRAFGLLHNRARPDITLEPALLEPGEALVQAWALLERGAAWGPPLAGSIDWLGGCLDGSEDAEAWLLLGAARSARRLGQVARARELLALAGGLARQPRLGRRVAADVAFMAWLELRSARRATDQWLP